jgi:hypothetical protein
MPPKISSPKQNIYPYQGKTVVVSSLDRFRYIIQGCIPTPLKIVPSRIRGRFSFRLTPQELKSLQDTLQGLQIPPRNVLRCY